MIEKEQMDDGINRLNLKLAFSAINIAIREMAQVSRNLTLAQLAVLQNKEDKALKEIGEINHRLDEVSKYLDQMSALVNE